jgi:hypothetical protein
MDKKTRTDIDQAMRVIETTMGYLGYRAERRNGYWAIDRYAEGACQSTHRSGMTLREAYYCLCDIEEGLSRR